MDHLQEVPLPYTITLEQTDGTLPSSSSLYLF